ncbi:MAG: shikimate kinase, partial [Dehalococcoidia bacterium]
MGQQDNPSFNIILVGFSFTGKTEVGREVARRLNRPFIDIDEEIVARSGKSILDIFAKEGEEGFRQRERKVLEEACSTEDAVISVGGGAV